MNEYTEIVMDHFHNPRNVGIINNHDGMGEVGDPNCGDFLRVYIKVGEDNILEAVRYQIRGCPASIACASVMTELAVGKDLDEAMMIEDMDIVKALGGLPEYKLHCSNLGATGLKKAIMNHLTRYLSNVNNKQENPG